MELPILNPFENEWITFGAFFIGIFLLIGVAEFVRSKLKWDQKPVEKWSM
jgi:hypothetical protein